MFPYINLFAVSTVLALSCLSVEAKAMTITCTQKGKSIDLDDRSIREKLEGEVLCVRDWDGEKQKERFVYKKGRKIEEELDGKRRHELKRYGDINGNDILDGEQVEYFPGTSKVRSRETRKLGAEVGLGEKFHESGAIGERTFHEKSTEKRRGAQVASIGYTKSGKIQFVRCSEERATTIDPKLCGFDGPSTFETFHENDHPRATLSFLNGKKTESIVDAKPVSAWSSNIQSGTVKEPKAAKSKTTNASDGSSDVTDLYANGKSKRKYHLDSSQRFAGVDEEWFESGGKARRTEYGRVKDGAVEVLTVKASTCWWENGSPRAEIAQSGDSYSIKFYWDNKQLMQSGTYKQDARDSRWDARDVDQLVSCDPYTYGLLPIGTFKSFNREGGIEHEKSFEDGKAEGSEKVYVPKGKPGHEVILEERENKKGRVVRARYFKDGKLEKDEVYFADGSVKTREIK